MAANEEKSSAEEPKKLGLFDSVLAPPDWLNHNYMENVLREHYKDKFLKVTRCSINTFTKPGDNFMGVIFRAVVHFTTQGLDKDESFVVKIEPFTKSDKRDLKKKHPFFKTEGRMYMEMLPVMQELLKNSGDPEIIAPGLIHYNDDPKCLIFEDAATEDFAMQHLLVPFKRTEMIAKKLGKFHALSYYINDQQPDGVVPSFSDGFYSEKYAGNWDFFNVNLQALVELTSEWGEEMKFVSQKLIALQPNFLKKMLELYKPNPKGISVLNHGDFHIRNLLFRYNEADKSKCEAIRFIDFQLSVFATPAIDLSYLLYMVSNNEAREENRNRLMKAYHDQFVQTLHGLGHLGKIPTLLDFQVEQLRHGIIEFFVATNFLSMFYMDLEKMKDVDFSDKSAVLQLVKDMYTCPTMKDILFKILPQFMNQGNLDS